MVNGGYVVEGIRLIPYLYQCMGVVILAINYLRVLATRYEAY